MKPGYTSFSDPSKQRNAFRGYVERIIYPPNSTPYPERTYCKVARVNKLKALEDAKKLIKRLRK